MLLLLWLLLLLSLLLLLYYCLCWWKHPCIFCKKFSNKVTNWDITLECMLGTGSACDCIFSQSKQIWGSDQVWRACHHHRMGIFILTKLSFCLFWNSAACNGRNEHIDALFQGRIRNSTDEIVLRRSTNCNQVIRLDLKTKFKAGF